MSSQMSKARSRPSRSGFAVIAALAVLGLTALAIWVSRNGDASRPPITLRTDGGMMETTLQQRIDASGLVVLGTVGEPFASRWTTETGDLPPNTTPELVAERGLRIYTDYPVRIEQILKGSAPSDTIRVRILGGQAGQDRDMDDDAAVLRPGQRMVLLLRDDDGITAPYGPAHYTTSFGFLSAYDVEGARAVIRSDAAPADRPSLPSDGVVAAATATTATTASAEETIDARLLADLVRQVQNSRSGLHPVRPPAKATIPAGQ